MLRIIQQSSADAAKSYYSTADYLAEGQEIIGTWGGQCAKRLGLQGTVDKPSFDMLCENKDPRSGERLTLRSKANRTVGYDFNFHVPKGVTLAYLLNRDDRILDLFQDTMNETMEDIEKDAATRVRKNGQMEERQTDNLAWGSYIHTTSRPIDGEPDPHLHGHCFVFNTTWDPVEQSFKAVQFRDIKRDAPYYEAAFHARLAKGMKELGYSIKREGRTWDIAGLERETIEKFSRRTAEIDALAKELGIEDAASKDQLGAKSRSKKDKSKSLEQLQKDWRKRLTWKEKLALKRLMDGDKSDVELHDAEAMHVAKLHCFERHSVVPERKLLEEALRMGVGNVTVEGIRRQLGEQHIINRNMHGRTWVTTHEVLAEESTMLSMAKQGIGKEDALNPGWIFTRDWLNDDQKNAVGHVLSSKDKVMIIRGGAGTGKTTLMKEAIEAMEDKGKKVFTFAPSAEASRGVLAAEGFQSTTVAELLISEKLQQEIRNQVIWIDEAGLLGTRTLKQVMDVAENQHARLILSGDWKQHGSVERGAALRLLEEEAGIKPAMVRNIQRQSGEYREAVAELAEGNIYKGFQTLDRLGWVHEIESKEQRYQEMAISFANGMDAGESVLAVTPTHAEAEILTSNIRDELKRRGSVSSDEKVFIQLKPMHLTEGQRRDAFEVSQGDLMVFHRGSKEIKKGARMDANETNANRFKRHSKSFDVYRRNDLHLAKGDLIKITKNGKTKDQQHSLSNGNVFRIRDFNKSGDIVLTNGWTIPKDYGFLTTGYVSTSHSSQGKTVNRVLIAESEMSYPAADHAQFYVSVSRGRNRAEIYTDDKLGLIEAVCRQHPRISATELVTKRELPVVKRLKREQIQQLQREQVREHERIPEYERV